MAATITEIDGIKIGEEIFTFTSSSGASVRTTKKTIAASDWKTSTASADVSRGKYYYSIYLDGLIGTTGVDTNKNLLNVRFALNTSPYEAVFLDYTLSGTTLTIYSNNNSAIIVVASYSGVGNDPDPEPTPSPTAIYYDTIIANQEEFETWYQELDAGTYEGHSVLFLNGTYERTDGSGLHLPDTLKYIEGVGAVNILLKNLNGGGGIYYDTTITPSATEQYHEYLLKNIYLTCSVANGKALSGAFLNCANLYNCFVQIKDTGSSYTPITGATGFVNCVNLTDCSFSFPSPIFQSFHSTYGFFNCTNLLNCSSLATASNSGDGFGFYRCYHLCNCSGIGYGRSTGSNSGDGYGFYECVDLVNCIGSGNGSPGKVGFSFYNCSQCSNCHQSTEILSTTDTWGGTNTNIDPNTCPEYKIDSTNNNKVLGVVDGRLTYVDKVTVSSEINSAGGLTFRIKA